ncbi:gluconokinase [Pseudoduganella eburnea]|uniref:Gluconokinase n=1 Tax=Massilia eburnea TaxID=1776165 RepID=A0A6L6QJ84_9BURK|nr:gluconokinase [Massilia eburnea]MTW12329.1 gluconokinase [Massilia eburnea]
MGVSGAGKSLVGSLLARELGVPFHEGDDFHPAANVARMAAGIPLGDADRAEWLARLAKVIRQAADAGEGMVLSCSALKRRYRDRLRAADPTLRFACLAGARGLLAQRMQGRAGHYMPLSLLDSQLAALEPLQDDEAGLQLDIRLPPAQLVAAILARE